MRLHHAIAPLGLAALLAGCGDSLVDHTNTTVRDQQQPTTCGANLVQCGTECRSQLVGDPGWVCGTSCTPCTGFNVPANATLTCTPVGAGGHDGQCGYSCPAGFLGTGTGCSSPALVAAGGQFSCATAADNGEVHCWGANDQGQLGPNASGTSRSTAGPVDSTLLTGVSALAAGPAHACAVVGATTYCWGDATGWGGNASSATAVAVPGLAGVTTLAAGRNHTCGIAAGGVLKCAGASANGGVDGGGVVSLGGAVAEVAAGDSFSCALVQIASTPTVKCWGKNDHAQSSGNANATATPVGPTTVTLTTAAGVVLTHVAAGATHACAGTNGSKTSDPVVFCWGSDISHQLGVNGTSGSAVAPVASNINKPLSAPTAAMPTILAAGGVTTCEIKSDLGNFLQCWGGDATAAGGGLGIGELIDLTSLSPPGAVSVGGGHGCVVNPAGKLACWGHGAQGQLGNAGLADSIPPVFVVDVR